MLKRHFKRKHTIKNSTNYLNTGSSILGTVPNSDNSQEDVVPDAATLVNTLEIYSHSGEGDPTHVIISEASADTEDVLADNHQEEVPGKHPDDATLVNPLEAAHHKVVKLEQGDAKKSANTKVTKIPDDTLSITNL